MSVIVVFLRPLGLRLVDAGDFPEFTGVGNAVDASPEFERPASAFTLWVVLRDGRGGADWTRREVGAPPP